MKDAESWHALFAPLPAGAVPERKPVASPGIAATPEASAIAGWQNLTIELRAGSAGVRVAAVLVDGDDRPLSASEWVMYRSERVEDGRPVVEWRHETVGGRLEPDGTFRGTRWLTVLLETEDGQEIEKESTPSPPSAADEEALDALVGEVLRRAGS